MKLIFISAGPPGYNPEGGIWLKTYLKILAISISIILFSVVLSSIMKKIVELSGRSSVLPTLVWVVGLLFSALVGIILPLRLCSSAKSKIITILLMPTNYILLVLLFFVYELCKLSFDIIWNFSPHFG